MKTRRSSASLVANGVTVPVAGRFEARRTTPQRESRAVSQTHRRSALDRERLMASVASGGSLVRAGGRMPVGSPLRLAGSGSLPNDRCSPFRAPTASVTFSRTSVPVRKGWCYVFGIVLAHPSCPISSSPRITIPRRSCGVISRRYDDSSGVAWCWNGRIISDTPSVTRSFAAFTPKNAAAGSSTFFVKPPVPTGLALR